MWQPCSDLIRKKTKKSRVKKKLESNNKKTENNFKKPLKHPVFSYLFKNIYFQLNRQLNKSKL